jgi:hypothetical protein
MAKATAKTAPAKTSRRKPASPPAKAAKKSAARSKSRAAAKPLTTTDKQRLVKPADGFTELTERFANAWTSNRLLKVPGLSPAKILGMLTRAKKAAGREEASRRKLEEKLKPLQDARLQAEHDVWMMVLDAYAVAKAQARVAPELGRAFAFMGESLGRRSRGKKKEAASEPETEPKVS